MTERSYSLADAILPLDAIVQPEKDDDSVIVAIIGDKRLEYEGRVVDLRPDAIMLNGLLRVRGKWASGAQVRDAGQMTFSASNFTLRMHHLRDNLAQVSGLHREDIVQSKGKTVNKQYQLSERLLFIDRRDERSGEKRQEKLSRLFREYADHPQVLTHAAWCQSKVKGRQSKSDFLSADSVVSCIGYIEHAAVTTEVDSSLAVAATCANQELLFSLLPKIRQYATVNAHDAHMWDELYQEGCQEAIRVITSFCPDHQDAEQVKNHFYAKSSIAIQGVMSTYISRSMASHWNMSRNDYDFSRRVLYAQESLALRHGREPSPVEIATETNGDVELVEWALYRLGQPASMPLDSYLLRERAPYWDGESDLNSIVANVLTDYVFCSDILEYRQKIVLSILYGVYNESLNQAHFKRKNRHGRETTTTFIYPESRQEFVDLVRKNGETLESTATLLGLTKHPVGDLAASGLAAARKVIRHEFAL